MCTASCTEGDSAAQSAKTRATSYREHVLLLLEPPWCERTHFQQDRQNIEAPVRNHGCRGKAKSVTYSECVFVALVMRMSHITLSSVVCLVLPYFSTLSNKW